MKKVGRPKTTWNVTVFKSKTAFENYQAHKITIEEATRPVELTDFKTVEVVTLNNLMLVHLHRSQSKMKSIYPNHFNTLYPTLKPRMFAIYNTNTELYDIREYLSPEAVKFLIAELSHSDSPIILLALGNINSFSTDDDNNNNYNNYNY